MELISDIIEIYSNYDFKTEVLLLPLGDRFTFSKRLGWERI